MTHSPTPKGQPMAAVFVDAENHADLDLEELESQLLGVDVVAREAYADWRNHCLYSLSVCLLAKGFVLRQAWSGYRPGIHKNTADGHMVQGINRLLADRPGVNTIVIVSGDAFFVPLARELRRSGKRVIVAADPRRLSHELVALASEILPIGRFARTVEAMDRLQRKSDYVTFGFALKKARVSYADLVRMIEQGHLVQDLVSRPERGVRREIWLNPQSKVVQAVLGRAA